MSSGIFRAGLFDGQVAIVSGGGSGIGRVTALQFAALGATVIICGRRPDPLAQTAGLDPSGRIHTAVCDVREEDQVDALMDMVLAEHGRIDILVNNAGGQFLAPAEQITPKGFRTVIRLNVESTWLMTHAAATKAMIPAGSGTVISVTLSPHNGMPGMVHSGAARAAVENMMKTLSVEWARYGIRCNAVAPGQIATDVVYSKYPQQLVEMITSTIPAARMGAPEEIAAAIIYLASPAGAFTSGTTLTVDGARDNWFGHWPPEPAADADGMPLSEQRRD
jgi:NAD(P)-dependent dehydrogenase (short-subunit alcohol dehydrogenase family)